MKKVVPRKYGWVIAVILGLFLCIAPLSSQKVLAREFADRVNITLYYRVRFETLGQSPKGLYYIHLFDTHTAEITQTALHHPALFVESLAIIKAWESKLDTFVNGHGDQVILTEEDVQGVLTYLDHLAAQSSPELKSVIDTERSILPLDRVIGMDMNQAWSYLSQDPRFLGESVPEIGMFTAPDPSTYPESWTVPEDPRLVLNFDNNVWELILSNNGVSPAWELKHRSLYDCVITVPRVVNDPYAFYDTATRTLGELPYEVRASRFSEWTLYVLYRPLYASPVSENFWFILYPGVVDTQACLKEGETLLGNISVMH